MIYKTSKEKRIIKMSECTHNCQTCGNADCASKNNPEDMHEKLNDLSSVKHVIGVVSGKGGVGKTTKQSEFYPRAWSE